MTAFTPANGCCFTPAHSARERGEPSHRAGRPITPRALAEFSRLLAGTREADACEQRGRGNCSVVVSAILGALAARRASYERDLDALDLIGSDLVARARHRVGSVVFDYRRDLTSGNLLNLSAVERSEHIADVFTILWAQCGSEIPRPAVALQRARIDTRPQSLELEDRTACSSTQQVTGCVSGSRPQAGTGKRSAYSRCRASFRRVP